MSQINNQKLMDYISGKLPAEEQHEVEKWMMENPFNEEAVEGLRNAGSEKKVNASVEQINNQLRRYLNQKKTRRSKKTLPSNTWTYLAILIILLLAVLLYFVIKKMD